MNLDLYQPRENTEDEENAIEDLRHRIERDCERAAGHVSALIHAATEALLCLKNNHEGTASVHICTADRHIEAAKKALTDVTF